MPDLFANNRASVASFGKNPRDRFVQAWFLRHYQPNLLIGLTLLTT